MKKRVGCTTNEQKFRCSQAVIFDLDGVIVDSERVYRKAYEAILHQYGVDFSATAFRLMTGTTLEKNGAKNFIDFYKLPLRENELITKIYDFFDNNSHSIRATDGVLELISTLRKKQMKVGLATSTVRSRALLTLKYAGVSADLFDALVFGDDVPVGKPSPDIYQKCLQMLKVLAGETVVFEDSVNGVKAALNAGIGLIIGVLHENNSEDDLINAGADFAERPPHVFKRWIPLTQEEKN